MTRYVIIGDGAAGTTGAQYIRQRDRDGQITIYSDDTNPAYYRAALTNYVIGELREDQLFAVPPDFYARHRVDRVFDRVVGIDTGAGTLSLASGGAPVPYDRLLVAAGATPNLPPFPGSELAGVMTMRTLQDARTVLELLAAGKVRRALVIGGGPLGLEWVQGLRARGVEVTYLVRGQVFMSGILDGIASDLVLSRLRSYGVDLRLDEEVGEAMGSDGRLTAVRLKNSGDTVQVQLLGVAIGIRMNTEFLEGSGLSVNRGLPVDEHMRTNVENVYGAGDVAEVPDPKTGGYRTFGLWEPARLQGRVAGMNMAGGNETYRVGAHYMATRLYDLDFASINESVEQPGDRTVVDFPQGKGRITYRKLIIRDGKLVGALLLGLRKEGVRDRALQFKRLIDEGVDVSSVADDLLDPRFDLASWMDSLGAPDDRDVSRVVAPVPSLPSISQLMVRPSALEMTRAAAAEPEAPPEEPKAEKPERVLPAAALSIEATGHRVPLMEVVRIGRDPDNDLTVDDPQASRHHAEARKVPGVGYAVADAGSRNGTFLNDVPVTAPTSLNDGDVIRVGDTRIRFALEAASEEPSQAPGPVGLPSKPMPIPASPGEGPFGVLQANGTRFDLRAPVSTLGRDPKSEVFVDDPAVSFLHAQISRHDRALYLRDLGSRNGTYVNGNLVTVPHLLQAGDVVHVGDTDLAFAPVGEPRVSAPKRAEPGPPEPAAPAPTGVAGPGSTRVASAPEGPGFTRVAGVPEAPPARLTVREGPLVGLSFALAGPTVRAGRDPDGEVVVRDQMVSWHHARFDLRGSEWTITDPGSTNGTEVNGERIPPNVARTLASGDQVRLGQAVVLEFEVG